jgi:hypothetical protein
MSHVQRFEGVRTTPSLMAVVGRRAPYVRLDPLAEVGRSVPDASSGDPNERRTVSHVTAALKKARGQSE